MKKWNKNVWAGISFGIFMTISSLVINFYYIKGSQPEPLRQIVSALIAGVAGGVLYGFIIGKMYNKKNQEKDSV